jgi:hypothetical protein
MQHANLLETLENVIPDDMLLRIAPVLTPSPSLSSLRQSAAARFQSENVSGSDDEKPEPLSQSPDVASPRSPQFSMPNFGSNSAAAVGKRHSTGGGAVWTSQASPPATSSSSNRPVGKRHSMWAVSDAKTQNAAALPSSIKRLSLSQASAAQQFIKAGGSQDGSPSSVTVSPVDQFQAQSPPSAHPRVSSSTSVLVKRHPARSSLSIPHAPSQQTAGNPMHRVEFDSQAESSGMLESLAEDDEDVESLDHDDVKEAPRGNAIVRSSGPQQAQQRRSSLAIAAEPKKQSWAPTVASMSMGSRRGSAAVPSLLHAAASSGIAVKGSRRASLY